MPSADISLLHRSWSRTWQHLGLVAPDALLPQLLTAYGEPQRHYHTLQHLRECLAAFELSPGDAVHPGEVELALWFHDAVYDVKAHDNELRSAEWARLALQQAGATAQQMARVHGLIMATCHGAAVPEVLTGQDAQDAQLLVDIDLAILGAAPARFAEYDAQVRAEYSWVPAAIYRSKRKAVLQGFLQREAIYRTPAFHSRLEAQARHNLAAAIHQL